ACKESRMTHLPYLWKLGAPALLLCSAAVACRSGSPEPAPAEPRPTSADEPPAAASPASVREQEQLRELREKADLQPVSGEHHADDADELRDDLQIRPDPTPPPANEAEMRERMGLHPDPPP